MHFFPLLSSGIRLLQAWHVEVIGILYNYTKEKIFCKPVTPFLGHFHKNWMASIPNKFRYWVTDRLLSYLYCGWGCQWFQIRAIPKFTVEYTENHNLKELLLLLTAAFPSSSASETWGCKTVSGAGLSSPFWSMLGASPMEKLVDAF